MVTSVIKFSSEGYKIRSIFGQEARYSKEIIVFCELTWWGGGKKSTCSKITIVYQAKGQLISELLFGVLNFPKNQPKNLKDFWPRI